MMIKFVLILGGTALAITYFVYLKRTILDRLLVLITLGAMIFFVMNPDLTSQISQRLFGVGRGTDLLLYLSIPSFLLLIMLLFIRIRENERKLTSVVRNLAVHQARKPADSQPPPRSPESGASKNAS